VNRTCVVSPQSIVVFPENHVIKVGSPQDLIFSVNFTNKDTQNCSTSAFDITLQGGVLPAVENGIWAAYNLSSFTTAFKLTMDPSDSFSVPVVVKTVELLAPGRYSLVVVSQDQQQLSHAQVASLYLAVECPKPRPVWNFHIQEYVSSFGTNLGNILYWNACIVAAECCCPCTYEIVRDDKVIGRSNLLNYTDQTTLSQVGDEYNYTITVIDRNQIRSSPFTCGHSQISVVSSSGLDFVIVLIILAAISFFPTAILGIECCRYHRGTSMKLARMSHRLHKARVSPTIFGNDTDTKIPKNRNGSLYEPVAFDSSSDEEYISNDTILEST